ncbi:VOC family protein [Actinomadura litoris]|uniref:VOC family protein n=1 Tax=Actinomadura litoris TaxID=2678616 RepID=UPI0028A658FB|nr:VOC family protein [Actinomadura litoris]
MAGAEAETAARAVPRLGSMLLASTDPDRLRAWYEKAFGLTADMDGFLDFGGVGVLVDGRDDVADRAVEPARVILNMHVPDARAVVAHLDSMDVTWLAPLEYREVGSWFATAVDPDGNHVQIIELTEAYWAGRRERAQRARVLRGAEREETVWTLADASASGRLPARDLDRARRFYADKLGLEPVESRPGGLRYETRDGGFSLFQSAGRPSGDHTQIAWKVDDIDAVVAELRRRGVVFEEVDVPGLRTVNGITEVEGNYPSAGGRGERAAWFRDSEGNLHGVGQAIHGAGQNGDHGQNGDPGRHASA